MPPRHLCFHGNFTDCIINHQICYAVLLCVIFVFFFFAHFRLESTTVIELVNFNSRDCEWQDGLTFRIELQLEWVEKLWRDGSKELKGELIGCFKRKKMLLGCQRRFNCKSFSEEKNFYKNVFTGDNKQSLREINLTKTKNLKHIFLWKMVK